MKKITSIIHTSEPVLDGHETKYLLNCLKRNWISFGGRYTVRFERKFAGYIGVKHAILCSHGTDALQLALAACGVGAGDEVIIPDLTIIVSASTIIRQGARPVLADVDRYWCLDPDKIEAKITGKTKAIMVVHMYGIPADMNKIMKIARRHNLLVIEDACAALGSEVNGRKVGSIGDIGCFSFYASKTITMGEGGAITTNNVKLAQRARSLLNISFKKPRFIHDELGFNYRITDLQAAVGLAQIEKINTKLKKRILISERYKKLLKNVPEIDIPQEPSWGKTILWMFPIIINQSFGRSRDDVMKLLYRKGIQTDRFFLPMSRQPVFQKKQMNNYPDISGTHSNSIYAGENGLYLPGGLRLTLAQQQFIVDTLLSLRKH